MVIAELFAAIVSVASAFATGRDINQQIDALEFQRWLIEQGHGQLLEEIENWHVTSVYVKAILNQQLPLIFEKLAINTMNFTNSRSLCRNI